MNWQKTNFQTAKKCRGHLGRTGSVEAQRERGKHTCTQPFGVYTVSRAWRISKAPNGVVL